MAYTSDDLVTAIKRDSYLPAAQVDYTPAVLLGIADEQTIKTDGVAGVLVSLKQGFYEEFEDAALVVNQAEYDVSRYAMWSKFRHVELVDAAGAPYPLDYIEPEQVRNYGQGSSTPQAYLFRSDQFVLVPKPTATGLSLRQYIFRRPGRLVPLASAAQVSTAAGTLVTYTGSKPATFTASSVHDFYRGTSPFRRIGTAKTATGSPAGNQQNFAAGDVALLLPGDWVCLRDETVFPAMPIELHDHLKNLVIVSLSRAQMDQDQYAAARGAVLEKMRAEMIHPGSRTNAPKKISIPPHRVGYMGLGRWTR